MFLRIDIFFKGVIYFLLKNLCKLFNILYFRRVRIYGRENIPKNAGIIYCANHSNGFLDALLIGTYTPKKVFSLTRSDVFNNRFSWIMAAIGMLPIYRMRDGYEKLRKNQDLFARCREVLAEKKSLIMFPEAGQNLNRFLKPLSKGSTRLAYQTQKQYPSSEIYLQPIGINFSHLTAPRATLHLVFGQPISVKKFTTDSQKDPVIINQLKGVLTKGIKKCLWLPEKEKGYEKKWRYIDKKIAKKDFNVLKDRLSNNPRSSSQKIKSRFMKHLFTFPNFIPLMIVKKILGMFKEQLFYHSMKYALGLALFPIYWIITGGILWIFTGIWVALIYFVLCVISLFLRQCFSS